jgi:hypothetical protein
MSNKGISVVIATLGGPSLIDTINSINSGTLLPNEILVCIPKVFSKNVVKYLIYEKVFIIETEVSGQVAQRAIGFTKAKYDYVLQIDDDVILHSNCLEILFSTMSKNISNIAISPALYTLKTNLSIYRSSNSYFKKYIIKPIYYFLINGTKLYTPGTITSAGTQIGIDPSFYNLEIIPTEWLPGGCVLHHKINLLKYNFYPFTGKAYLEDLYHSFLLRQQSVKLFIVKSAVAKIVDPREEIIFDLNIFFRELYKDYKSRKYFIKLSNKSALQLHIFYVLEVFKILVFKIKKII